MPAESEPLALVAAGDESLDVPLNRRVDIDRLFAHLQPSGVDARDVQELGDQPGNAVRVGLDGLQHQPLLVVGETVPAAKKSRRKALHRGQRRAQLVSNSGDQRGAVGLRTSARLSIAYRHDNLTDRHISSGAHVFGGHQYLMQSGDDQQLLAGTGAYSQSVPGIGGVPPGATVVLPVSYTHLRAHETDS